MSSLMMCCCLFLLFGLLSEGRKILVGGRSKSWKVPESTGETLNQWSERTRFKIGDSLFWKDNAENVSVMQVNQRNYKRCDRSEPIRGYKDGHTKIELKKLGPFYFISGEEGHCHRDQKLRVVVLSPNHNRSSVTTAPAPVNALVMKKGSLNGAWSLAATPSLLLLLPLALLV